jgi:hypothetical protein
MNKIAFVRLGHDDTMHRIPATDVKEEGMHLVIYHGDQVVGRFTLHLVQHWALELAEDH